MKKGYSIIIISCLFILDLISKMLILKFFNVNDSLVLISNFLKICYVKNTGISFGLFSNNVITISIISIFIIGYMIYELLKTKNKLSIIACSLILSGSIGNLIDRVFRGYVVDFISFTLFNREMAIFNVADICITFGVLLYIVMLFKEGKNERVNSK